MADTNQDHINSQTLPGGLYLVATPIGNLGDITLRALDTLKRVDFIACEDTRVSGKLLSHYGIHTPTLSYHEHNAAAMRPKLLSMLEDGKAIAMISDAGTPLISDPGFKLVRELAALGIKVIPIPGASSVTSALCASGLPTDRFLFAGFLSTKVGARKKELESLAKIDATVVIFESGRRIAETLAAVAEVMPDREAVVARELTKLYEEFRRGSVAELMAYYNGVEEVKGEIVLLLSPAPQIQAVYNEQVEQALKEAMQSLSVKDAAAKIAAETGLPRQELYTHALALKEPK